MEFLVACTKRDKLTGETVEQQTQTIVGIAVLILLALLFYWRETTLLRRETEIIEAIDKPQWVFSLYEREEHREEAYVTFKHALERYTLLPEEEQKPWVKGFLEGKLREMEAEFLLDVRRSK